LPDAPKDRGHVYNQFTMRTLKNRAALLEHLKACGVDARVYYPMLLSSMKAFKRYRSASLPHAQRACEEVFSVPAGPFLSRTQMSAVAGAVRQFF